jgi:uncharacterized membrane protein YkoI
MKVIRVATLALMCLCLAGIGWASNDDKDQEKKEHETARSVLSKAKVDLSTAIETAQKKIPTGKPLFAITEVEHGTMQFDVYLLVGDSATEVEVDVVTGEVGKVEEGEDKEVEHLPEAKKGVSESKVTFAQAIALATSKVPGGKPFEIEYEMEDGKLVIEIELLADDKIMEVEIDAMTGNVVEVEEVKD